MSDLVTTNSHESLSTLAVCLCATEAYNETQNAFPNLDIGACPKKYNPVRFELNAKRLTEAWFRWNFVRLMEKARLLPNLTFTRFEPEHWNAVLESWTPQLLMCFMQKWGSEHVCGKPGTFV
jgi:hypothetical protein